MKSLHMSKFLGLENLQRPLSKPENIRVCKKCEKAHHINDFPRRHGYRVHTCKFCEDRIRKDREAVKNAPDPYKAF